MRSCDDTTSSSFLGLCVKGRKVSCTERALDRIEEDGRRWVQTEGDRERGTEA